MRRNLVLEQSKFPHELIDALQQPGAQRQPVLVPGQHARRVGRRARASRSWPTSRTRARSRSSTGSAACRRSTRATSSVALALAKIFKAANVKFAILGKEETLQRRSRAPRGQRIPLSDPGPEQHRATEPVPAQTHRRELPALLQHAQERVPAAGRQLRGGAPQPVHPGAHRGGPTAGPDGHAATARHGLSRPVLPRTLQRGLRRAARGAEPGRRAGFVEMPRCRDKGFCCGAGGARAFMEEKRGTRISHNRLNEALETEAPRRGRGLPVLRDDVRGRHPRPERRGALRDQRHRRDRRRGTYARGDRPRNHRVESLTAGPRHTSTGGSPVTPHPRSGESAAGRSVKRAPRAEQRLAAGGCKLPRPKEVR